MRLRHAFLLILLLHFLPAHAFVFKQYNSLNGLSNDNVFDLIEDKEGYIWIATGLGLNRLGPNGIENFYKSDGLFSNVILSLDIDRNGILWIGTNGGLCTFENGKIVKQIDETYIFKPIELIVEDTYIYYVDQSGNLFIYNRKTKGIIKTLTSNAKVDEGNVRKICRSSDGGILVAAYNGLYKIKDDDVQKLYIKNLNDSSFFHVTEDNTKSIWLTSGNRIYTIKKGEVINLTVLNQNNEAKVKNVLIDNYNKLWYSGIDNTPYLFMLFGNNKYDINNYLNVNTVVNSCLSDNNNDIWFGTFGKGIYVLRNEPFQYYDIHKGLSTNYVTDVSASSDATYIGTNISFNYKLKTDSQFHEIKFTKKGNVEYVRNITRFKNHFLVSIFNQELSGTPVFYEKFGTDTVVFFNGRHVYGDEKKNIAIVDLYNDSLNIFNYEKGKFNLHKKIDLLHLLGPNAGLNRIDRIGDNYLICTRRGLVVLDTSFTDAKVYLKNLAVFDAIYFMDRILVCGEFGLMIYSLSGQSFQLVKERNDKPVFATSLGIDSKNRLWIGSTNGVYSYSNNGIDYIGSNDGLPSIHISNFTYNNESDELWLSTYNGAIVIQLNDFNHFINSKHNKFIIEKIIADDKIFIPDTISRLKIYSRNLQIKMALFNYIGSNNYLLRYKLDGEKWIYAQGNNINLSYVKPGNHQILIQSSEYGFSWSSPVSYSFYVVPYWYQYLWVKVGFWILGLTMVFILVVLIIRRNNQKSEKKFEFQRKVMDLKMQALNAAINSHFVFNVLNAIQYFVSSKQDVKASKFIADFARFMRIIIDNSNLTIIPISEEIRRIHLYIGLEIMRFEDRLTYTVEIDESINQEELMIPNMIIQPFVENSILHGILSTKNKGVISIRILDKGDNMQILIKDNGIGINTARLKKNIFNKKSIGLKNVIQRLELFSGERSYSYSVKDLSEFGETGTIVDVIIPKIRFSDL